MNREGFFKAILTVLFLCCSTAFAADRLVPSQYPTIQSAIDAVVNGDTVIIASAYSGGSGEPNDPFRIATISDWQTLMSTPADWNKYFILKADLDLKGITVTPVAPDTSTAYGFQGTKFTGVLDGNGHIICNADIYNPTKEYVGLFGYVSYSGQIRNLGIEDVNITGRHTVGGLVGYNYYSNITDCYVTGAVNGFDYVGGLIGYQVGSSIIKHCYATGLVRGRDYVGGLLGFLYSGDVTTCFADSSVNGSRYGAGGLIGMSYYGSAYACYAIGTVNGNSDVGGLIGENYYSHVSNCYATGAVGGDDFTGGLIGTMSTSGATIRYCYSTGAVSGGFSGGLVGYYNGSEYNC